MNFFVHALVLILALASVLGMHGSADNAQVRDYLSKLGSPPYDKRIAPEGNDGKGSPLTVQATAFILDVHTVDDSNMDFTAEFYFRQYWKDSRLAHDFSHPIQLREVERIWTPDLFFVEERQGSLHKIMHPNIFCRIEPSGEVIFSSKLSITFSCPMNLRNYPHDIQKCTINAESYGYKMEHIDLEWREGYYKPISFSETIKMLEFDLTDVMPSEREISLMSGNYSTLQMNMVFKRKFGFFATRLYVPFIILVLMTTLSLWINADERCLRLAFLLVILYLMVSISTSLNSAIPHTPYTKASDVWIGFCQSLVFAAFLEFIVVAVIAGRESEESARSKGEVLLTLESEEKQKTDSLKSPLTKVVSMFDARKGFQNTLSLRIDKICRLVFPIIFLIFNIIYWSVYCCSA